MQSIGWYFRRLRSMSPDEIFWRISSKVRDVIDRGRMMLNRFPKEAEALKGVGRGPAPQDVELCGADAGAWKNASGREEDWLVRLLEKADKLKGHTFSFFDLVDRHLGDPIDWNRDHACGKATPMGFAPKIDYRDFDETGDCKLVWEPSRHHQLVVLARAYRATGDKSYAQAVVEQMQSWMDQCPFPRGMQWRSPLELAIRVINWVWAIDFIKDSGLYEGAFKRRVQHAVYLHLWDVSRKFSKGSSANNHLIGEAAGVFIASSYFSELSNTAAWREASRQILIQEAGNQTYADGGNKELALGYHLFVLQFFLFAGMVARKSGNDFPAEYWQQVEKMFSFLAALNGGGEALSFYGDCDDGYVLDLGGHHARADHLFSTGAVLFNRADLKAMSGGYQEPTWWLLGEASRGLYDKLDVPEAVPGLPSCAFPDTGIYLLQCGGGDAGDRVSILFDCGELGYKSIAAHGHADALSFTVRYLGDELLVDPGTYDYFTFGEWRNYFRSTRAHNTLEIDGEDQSVMSGLFLWGKRASARCLEWQPAERGGKVVGVHDGYARLQDPVVHQRALALDGDANTLTVTDKIEAQSDHQAVLYFHVAESCEVALADSHNVEIKTGKGKAVFTADKRCSVELVKGREQPILGWVSRAYHCREETTVIVCTAPTTGVTELKSLFVFEKKE